MQNFRQKIFSVLLSTHPVGVERSADVEISGKGGKRSQLIFK